MQRGVKLGQRDRSNNGQLLEIVGSGLLALEESFREETNGG